VNEIPSRQVMLPTTWFRYPRRVTANALGPALIALGLPALPPTVIVGLQVILGVPAYFDIQRISPMFDAFFVVVWMFFIAATAPRACSYLQRFALSEVGISRKLLRLESIIEWPTVTSVEKTLAPTYENRGWSQVWRDEVSLAIRSDGRRFVIYEQLEGFTEFKDALSAACRQRSIPQIVVDKSMATLSRLKDQDPPLYRRSRRKGIRTPVEQL
jgi:hypothetical protein